MIDLSNVEALVSRARWEAAHARPYFAYSLYWSAWLSIPRAARPAHGPRVLNAALDLCLDYLPKGAKETVEVASALVELTSGRDARSLSARGAAHSRAARDARDAGSNAEAWKKAEEAVADLVAATTVLSIDPDAWGTLGGVYKHMSRWARADGDTVRAEQLEADMLKAYEQGMRCGYDAYPVLNYLEQRAAFEARAAYAAAPPGTTPLLPPILQSVAEEAVLSRALEVRRQQFQRREDAPWAAFDLARGQHYLAPNVYRFLADLGVAVEDAKRAARSASDTWTVKTAMRSLQDLHEARYPIDGLDDALILLVRATTDGWAAGSWEPLARGDGFLTAELAETRATLERLAGEQAEHRAQFERLAKMTTERWSKQDEADFQLELKKFAGDVEPPAKKHLRVVWKVLGEKALELAMVEIPVLLGAGPLPAVGVLVAKLAAKLAANRVGTALGAKESE